jgi:hypothetical protein
MGLPEPLGTFILFACLCTPLAMVTMLFVWLWVRRAQAYDNMARRR